MTKDWIAPGITLVAIAVFVIQLVGIIANVSNIITVQPVRAIIVFVAAVAGALVQPCLLIGIAKIISLMESRYKNA